MEFDVLSASIASGYWTSRTETDRVLFELRPKNGEQISFRRDRDMFSKEVPEAVLQYPTLSTKNYNSRVDEVTVQLGVVALENDDPEGVPDYLRSASYSRQERHLSIWFGLRPIEFKILQDRILSGMPPLSVTVWFDKIGLSDDDGKSPLAHSWEPDGSHIIWSVESEVPASIKGLQMHFGHRIDETKYLDLSERRPLLSINEYQRKIIDDIADLKAQIIENKKLSSAIPFALWIIVGMLVFLSLKVS